MTVLSFPRRSDPDRRLFGGSPVPLAPRARELRGLTWRGDGDQDNISPGGAQVAPIRRGGPMFVRCRRRTRGRPAPRLVPAALALALALAAVAFAGPAAAAPSDQP